MQGREGRRGWAPLGIASLMAAIYTLVWGSIDYLMDRTFSLHIWDAGANFVLTNMSSQPDLDYGHLTSAPQNAIYVLFTPLTRAFPDPLTLIFAEDLLLGTAGIFVYLIAVEAWGSPGRALLVEGLYLFSYALFGAPFYPNHYEILFSVFFPIAYYLHLRRRPAPSAVFLVLGALCSSLGAVTAGLFVVLLLGPRLVSELRGKGIGVARYLADNRYPLVAGIASLAIFALPFALQGASTTLSYDHLAGSPTSPDVLGGLEFALPEKIVYALFVIVPFVPLVLKSRYVLLAVPYAGLAFLGGTNHYIEFSYQYTYTVGAILFIAWIESLRSTYSWVPWPAPRARPAPEPARRSSPWRLPGRLRRDQALLQMTAIGAVLGFFILPYSPGNALAGSFDSLPFHNYDFPSLVKITSYDQALWGMTEQVPMTSSVLIQEDMPMLTNRATWYEPGSYDGEPVQYAVADPSTFWFVYSPPLFIGPYTDPMIFWVNELHENESYGIVEEYEGAMLLERGYTGPATSFTPYRAYEPGVAFVGPNATYPGVPPGVVHVATSTDTSGQVHTEGVQVLPPGRYTLTYYVSAINPSGNEHLTIGLWTNETDPQPLVTRNITGLDFEPLDAWTPITLTFTLPGYVDNVYFGSTTAGWTGGLSLASVYLNQTSMD